MKRLIVVLIMLSFLVGLATYEVVSIHNIIAFMDKSIDELIPIYEENEGNITVVAETLDKLETYWYDRECNMCIMFNHKDLSMVSDSLNKLNTYTHNNNFDDAIAELYLLQAYIEKADHIMGFNIHNVL